MLIITHNIAPMCEYESSKQEFFRGRPALEFSPQQVSLWQGMKPIYVSDCDRIIIGENTIEFQRDRETYLSCLDQEPPLFINSPCILPFENQQLYTPISNTIELIAGRTGIDSSLN